MTNTNKVNKTKRNILVTKDVAANSVMIGVPARLVRTIEDK